MKSITKINKTSLFSIPVILGVIVLGIFISQNIDGALTFGQSTVDVTASVDQSISCSTNATSTDFGTLTTSDVSTADTDAVTTVSCNSSGGCTLNVQDAGDGSGSAGLHDSANDNLIASQTETLSAGSEGYGIQAATSSAGSGGELSIASVYNKTGDEVGALETSDAQLATVTEPVTDREVTVTHKAAISATTPSGSYSDTLTYSCTAN